ncbi:MAG: YCF48-related protein [Candidatus Binataceae bacterium]
MNRIAPSRLLVVPLAAALALIAAAGCHRKVGMPPLPERNITTSDDFFDVWPTSPERALIVGTRGKVILAEAGGRHFRRIDIRTDLAVFGIQMVDGENGYLCGQDGLVMRTRDGGRTWERLNSRTKLSIFALSFPDRLHGYLVGDSSLVLSTSNGGESFFKRQLEHIFAHELRDYALPYQDPVLYGVDFINDRKGWVVGEFGRIWKTDNGGRSWKEQQQSLVKQWKRSLSPNDDPRLADYLLPTMFAVSFRDKNRGAACGLEGWVIETGDGGKTWTFMHQSPRPGAPPAGLIPGAPQIPARDPLFTIQLLGAQGGMAAGLTGTVLKREPDGTWAHDQNVPALPLPLSQLRFFDNQHGWIVGYGTVLYTSDGGRSWRFCQG